MPRPKSQAQARLFGVIAGKQAKVRGKANTARRKGFNQSKARSSLRGVKVKSLPARKR
jgi:hypothetical protein